jgi:hypothetical protein
MDESTSASYNIAAHCFSHECMMFDDIRAFVAINTVTDKKSVKLPRGT